MKQIFAIICLCATPALAQTQWNPIGPLLPMTIDSNAHMYHTGFGGKTIWVDVVHNRNAIEYVSISYFLPDYLNSGDGSKGRRLFTLGRSKDFARNAYAVIYENERFIVLGSMIPRGGVEAGQHDFVLVIGHEIGHHVCGHTLEMMRSDHVRMELEADEYSGAAFRASIEGTLGARGKARDYTNDLVRAGQKVFSMQGSASHPPQEMRISAILKGYRTGKYPCTGRSIDLQK